MKRKLFNEYIFDDQILDLLPELNKNHKKNKYYDNIIFSNSNQSDNYSNNLLNFNKSKIPKNQIKFLNPSKLNNPMDEIPIDITVDTSNISKDDIEKQQPTTEVTNEVTFEQGSNDVVESTIEDSENEDGEDEDVEDDDSENEDSEDNDSEDDDSEDNDSEDEDSQDEDSQDDDSEDEDSQDDDSENEDSQDDDSENEDSEDENSEDDDSETTSDNSNLIDLRSLSFPSDTSYDSSALFNNTIVAYGKSVTENNGNIVSDSEYFLEVDGNDANLKLDVNGSPLFYADFKVNDLVNSINNNNYNDFLVKINKVKKETESDTDESVSKLESEIQSESESEGESSLNKLVSIEKVKPELDDNVSSEVIINIDHDKIDKPKK
jgi:hypothetical protein